jgi:hypothetical protein
MPTMYGSAQGDTNTSHCFESAESVADCKAPKGSTMICIPAQCPFQNLHAMLSDSLKPDILNETSLATSKLHIASLLALGPRKQSGSS